MWRYQCKLQDFFPALWNFVCKKYLFLYQWKLRLMVWGTNLANFPLHLRLSKIKLKPNFYVSETPHYITGPMCSAVPSYRPCHGVLWSVFSDFIEKQWRVLSEIYIFSSLTQFFHRIISVMFGQLLTKKPKNSEFVYSFKEKKIEENGLKSVSIM